MKKLKYAGGILLVVLAITLTLVALFFPDNGFFTLLWGWGMFTFRGEGSLMVIYLVSGLFAILGFSLFVNQAKSKEDV